MNHVDFLVTGATGFTGSAVTELLVSRGKKVRVLIRDASRSASFLERGIEVVVGDLNNKEAMKRAVNGASTVLHIAALFRQAGLPASEFYRVNVEGTRNLLDRAVEAGVEKVIHCSTVGVLGHIAHPPATEETPFNPGDPYQQSKMEGEKLFLEYVQSGKIKGTVIRPAMIYGPGDTRTLKIFKPIAEGKFFYVGPGDALVHFIDVRDLAESFLLAAERSDVNGEVFIIAGETALPLKDLVGIISELMGTSEPWLHLPVKPMQVLGSLCEAICTPLKIQPPIFRRRVDFFTKDRSFDVSKAKERLGFKPTRPLAQELSEIIESYVNAGIIDLSRKKRPSVMVRAICGKIHAWEGSARALYGWSKGEALGTTSHSLLKTQFPMELAAINKTLMETGRWQGVLLHRDHRGQPVKVMSRWKLLRLPSNRDPLILESNTLLQESMSGGSLMAIASSVFIHSPVCNLESLALLPLAPL
jgi:dihydroflavonol-4-reductase